MAISEINAGFLKRLAPVVPLQRRREQSNIIHAFGALLPYMLGQFGITTPLRIAHFLAQVAHESDGFSTTVEYASGSAYEGRKDLGNTREGDGKRFKGRGPIQLTGRANYQAFTRWLRKTMSDCPDFEKQPQLVAEFPWAAWAACFFWSEKGLNTLADRDDLVAVTRRINGGRKGLANRAAYLEKAKMMIAALDGGSVGV